jgi:DNA-binding NtrC family response regulator
MEDRVVERRKPRRIAVVVDDEPEVRGLAVTLLEESGLEVVALGSADEAFRYLTARSREVAVVFTDVVMPGPMSGAELAQVIAHNWPWIKVMVTSGYGPGDLPERAVYMPKPWRALDVLIEAERAAAKAA